MTEILASELFCGIDEKAAEDIISELGAYEREYAPGERIFSGGDKTTAAGVVISGIVCIENVDFRGNTNLIARLGSGDIFGEAFAAAAVPMRVDVTAAEQSRILFVPVNGLFLSSELPLMGRMRENFIRLLAEKNVMLSAKLECISKRTVREKVMTFLSMQAAGGREFDIPFDRQQMADYLCTDRSALSAELSRLKKEGIIDFRKNHFVLMDAENK